MADRNEVIEGMEKCIIDDCVGDKWSECECKYKGHGCIDALLKDALVLLKSQESQYPVGDKGGEVNA